MSAAFVPLYIDQGEDFTAQLIWTNAHDEPQPLVHPARMWIKDATGAVLAELETEEDPVPGTIPSIALSPLLGLVQIHMSSGETAALTPGEYAYDIFVTVDDNGEYAGPQVHRLVKGTVTIDRRYTELT